MTESSDDQKQAATIELPEKTYFKIGEVAKLLEVEPYVLRYWETEFEVLDPEKTNSGQRVYQRADIELLVQIQTLLYEEMFTIAGACRQIARRREGKSSYFDLEDQSEPAGQGTAVAGDDQLREQLQETRRELAAAETRANEKSEQLEEIRHHNSELEEQLQQVDADLNQATKELESLHREATELRRTNAGLREQLETLGEQDGGEDSEQVQRLQQRVEQLEQQLQQAQDEAQRRRRQFRRRSHNRRDKRSSLLGSLRREVETIAEMAEPQSG